MEFKITAFDTVTPDTKLSVTPINKDISANSSYKRDINRLIAKKVNEVIFALKKLKVFV